MRMTEKATVAQVAGGAVDGVDGERVVLWGRSKEMELIRAAFGGAPAGEVSRLRAECQAECSDGLVLGDDVISGPGRGRDRSFRAVGRDRSFRAVGRGEAGGG